MTNNRSQKHHHILLVDDEAGYCEVMRKRLQRRGYIVTTACGGPQALRSMRSTEFDIALVDLKMEDMDGIEVLRFFKAMAPSMPVILLTGHGSELAMTQGLRRGASLYLLKPVEFESLLEALKSLLAQSASFKTENSGS